MKRMRKRERKHEFRRRRRTNFVVIKKCIDFVDFTQFLPIIMKVMCSFFLNENKVRLEDEFGCGFESVFLARPCFDFAI